MNNEEFNKNFQIIINIFLIFCGLILIKLFYLQIIKGKELEIISNNIKTKLFVQKAKRGKIYDVNGKILVGNKVNFVGYFSPLDLTIENKEGLINRLKKIFSYEDIDQKINTAITSGEIVKIADIERPQLFLISEQNTSLIGVHLMKEWKRNYYYKNYAGHLFGYLDKIFENEVEYYLNLEYSLDDLVGKAGLEKKFDLYLKGKNGGILFEIDSLGKTQKILKEVPSQDGNSLWLTLNWNLQEVAEEALSVLKKPGVIIGLNPKNGEILFWVSQPSYDPSIFINNDYESIKEVLYSPQKVFFHRATLGTYPLGSVFKIFVAIANLENKIVSLNKKFFCPGYFYLGNKKFNCWKEKGHGYMDFYSGIANSCNVYFYNLGLRIGPELILKSAEKFFIDKKINLIFAETQKGHLPSPYRGFWYDGDTINLSIGQGTLLVTPLNVAVFISAIANRGTIWEPMVVKKITDSSGKKIQEFHSKVLDFVELKESTWEELHKAMRMVVTEGTGWSCNIAGLKVYGKTGTAQNPHGKEHAWFVGFASNQDEVPEISLVVFVENGGRGGEVAAPIASKILKKYYELKNE